MSVKITNSSKSILITVVLLGFIFLFQYLSDIYKRQLPPIILPAISAKVLKMVDLGLHAPIASLLWIDKRLEIVTLSDKNKKFLYDLNFINELDPKLSTPYAFSILVLPNIRQFSDRINTAIEIGRRGTVNAAPDWRIPFYLATIYYLDLKDKASAAIYFDLASRTPGAPFSIRRFSINYGIGANERTETKKIWQAIYDAARDEDTKKRAKNYIIRLEIFDFLDKAISVYKQDFGQLPENLQVLVRAGIIKEIPADPFGFDLVIDENGRVGIDKSRQK